jgi:hypothetical protein
MSNYQQPGAEHGRYDATVVCKACPLCDPANRATARLIQSGSFEWRCDNGHWFRDDSYKSQGQFLVCFDEPNAETRIDLTLLQQFRG